MTPPPLLGIVIPTLNERLHLPLLLDDLAALRVPHEIVVVDGGSDDGTRDLARERGMRVVPSRRGRGPQLNAGASSLDTNWLLFLHADVRMPEEARAALEAWLAEARDEEWAYFRFRLDGERWFYRLAEGAQRLRERVTGLAYGDQGLVVSRLVFESVGGYPDIPLMEDVEMVRKLRGRLPLRRLPADLLSSPRRYEREGRWRGWLRNGLLLVLHSAGVRADRLLPWYRPEPPPPEEREGGGTADRLLLVFAKEPREGRVKTRLARAIGAEGAAELYRRVGRRVVDQLRGGRYGLVVFYDPPEAGPAVWSWLGTEGTAFRAQDPGDLGARMAAAFRWGFRRARRVCVVGTDAPGVDRALVEQAFDSLDEADVVVGPAADGGYYLLALSDPRPALFEGIRWSTSRVLPATLAHASRMGLDVRLLEERTDLDTVDDLARLGLPAP